MPDDVAYFCSHDGYSPKNRGNWCDLGCGTDYNRMIAVPKRHVDKLTARAEADLETMRKALAALVAFVEGIDGKAADFGELLVVEQARAALAAGASTEPPTWGLYDPTEQPR